MSGAVYALLIVLIGVIVLMAIPLLNIEIPIITYIGDFMWGIVNSVVSFFQTLLGAG